MKRVLLLSGILALLATSPAYAQYVFIDVDGDADCDVNDVISDTTPSIDIYIDTNHNQDGSTAACSNDQFSLDIFSYEITLHCATTDITYGTFANGVTQFTTVISPQASNSQDFHIAYGGTGALTPGKYKVGTLPITVATGTNPVIAPVPATDLDTGFLTAFGSNCPGLDFDNSIKLRRGFPTPGPGDFSDACGPGAPTPVRSTTWGAIKNMYR